MLKRLRNSLAYILRKSFLIVTYIYALLGFVRVFVSLDGLFNDYDSFGAKLRISVLILFGVWLLCIIVIGLIVLFTRKRKVVEGTNGKAVYVMYGDLFSEKIVSRSVARRNICFAVNRCFDTVIDDHLIASASVHGVAMSGLYKKGTYTPKSLNKVIQEAISPAARFEMLTKQQKPQGNLKRYEVGTAVDISISDRIHYFMVGLCGLNQDLKAETSREEYCMAIQRLIEFCDIHAQGQPVLLPIIGGFLSRTGQSEKDLLKYIIYCFMINKDRINQDVYIVVRESAKDTVSIVDLN